jgi:carbamoyltransferase
MMLPPGARAGVLVYDGYGSIRGPVSGDPLRNLRETFSFFLFGPDGYECFGETFGHGYVELDEFPIGVTDSIGMLYELVTGLLGYDLMGSGKTMGLAAHGVPRYLKAFESFVVYGDHPTRCFQCATDSPELSRAIEDILVAGHGSFAVRADIAASVQALVNKTLLHCASFFSGKATDFLCISGGCALNTVANSFLVEHLPSNLPVVIPPHCGDAGLGLGALWLDQYERSGAAPQFSFRNGPLNPNLCRPGRIYSRSESHDAVRQFYPRVVFDGSISSSQDVASLLADGAIIGVLNGRSEIGPRSLGGRSIFADPRSVLVREKLNRSIKKREPFRPLAPIILQSDYTEYFLDDRCADAFMLKVATARDNCKCRAPAVVHVDGTARVQVVPEDGDPFLVGLLRAFRERTGIAVLLNTSFNRQGEPIVETPLDAMDAFLGMGLDGIFIDGEFYRPAPL